MLHTSEPSSVVFASAVAAVASMLVHGVACADMSYLTAPAPGGFHQACAGSQTLSINWPGTDYFLLFPPATSDRHESSFTGGAPNQIMASYVGQGATNGASATGGLGYVQMSASNTAPNSSFGAAGMANGGWSETFVVSSPGLSGQSGYMQFTLHANGTLFASGFAGSANFQVTAYKGINQIPMNPLFSPGSSTPISTDQQYGNWGVATYAEGQTASATISDTVTFAVPITFGTPFKLGIYTRAAAGMRSSSGVPGNSSATVNFQGGLVWGGITNVYQGLTPIGDVTIVSGSGVDWTQPAHVPAGPDLNGDGVVGAADLAILLGAWGSAGADLNGDGTTNAFDLAILLAAWG